MQIIQRLADSIVKSPMPALQSGVSLCYRLVSSTMPLPQALWNNPFFGRCRRRYGSQSCSNFHCIRDCCAVPAGRAESKLRHSDPLAAHRPMCGQLELAAPKKKHIIVNGKSEERLYTAYLEGAAVALYLGKSTEEGCCAAHISMAHSRFEGVQPGAYWLRVEKNQLIRLIPVRVTNEFRALKISPASAANRGAHHPRLISPTSLVPIWQIVLVHMSLSS